MAPTLAPTLIKSGHTLSRIERGNRQLPFRIARTFTGSQDSKVHRLNPGKRPWSTPLAAQLAAGIENSGPITLAAYMRNCLTSSEYGYYTRFRNPVPSSSPATTDPALVLSETPAGLAGIHGDFITSPEISQVFGELIGLWFLTEWMAQGQPKNGVKLIEFGPGSGSLIEDILRTLRLFKPLASAIERVHLIEVSEPLMANQVERLCGPSAQLTRASNGLGWESKASKHIPGLPLEWNQVLEEVSINQNTTPFFIAHEFFDALPIHAFRSRTRKSNSPHGKPTDRREWVEMLVQPTQFSGLKTESVDSAPEFQLVPASRPTNLSHFLPNLSNRYSAVSQISDAQVEICPDALTTIQQIARRIGGVESSKPGGEENNQKVMHPKSSINGRSRTDINKPASGAALIIDYGPASEVPCQTLRGISRHKLVHPFSRPGEVDLSADVDFTALAGATLEASPRVEVHGPVPQGAWLNAMGGTERVNAMISKVSRVPPGQGGSSKHSSHLKDCQEEMIIRSWRRLTDSRAGGMGSQYKVMAILPHLVPPTLDREASGASHKLRNSRLSTQDPPRRPVGFGGDVQSD